MTIYGDHGSHTRMPCQLTPTRVAGLLCLLSAASTAAVAVEGPHPGRIPLYAKQHPVTSLVPVEKAPIDPRGKRLFQPTKNGPGFGHHWVWVTDKIGFWVGMHIEPAFEREANGIDIFATKDIEGRDAEGFPIGGVAVDPAHNPGDSVNVTAIYQLLANRDPKGKVVAEKNLGRIGQNYVDVPELGFFSTEFIPNPAGRYAIVFGGEINGAKIENRTVCAFEDEEVHTFSCVQTRTPSVF